MDSLYFQQLEQLLLTDHEPHGREPEKTDLNALKDDLRRATLHQVLLSVQLSLTRGPFA